MVHGEWVHQEVFFCVFEAETVPSLASCSYQPATRRIPFPGKYMTRNNQPPS